MKTLAALFHGKKRLFITVVIVLFIGFTLLSVFVILVPPSYLDLHVSEEIQERSGKLTDFSMQAVSWFGNFPVSAIMILVTALLFYLFRYKRESLFVLLTSLSGIISTLLKMLINRPRPTSDVVTIIEIAKRQSFPSGHTLFYIVFFGFLIIAMGNCRSIPFYCRITVAAVSSLIIFLVPFSRIYLGAHWFTDVLGGFISGIFCLIILGYFYLFGKGSNAK